MSRMCACLVGAQQCGLILVAVPACPPAARCTLFSVRRHGSLVFDDCKCDLSEIIITVHSLYYYPNGSYIFGHSRNMLTIVCINLSVNIRTFFTFISISKQPLCFRTIGGNKLTAVHTTSCGFLRSFFLRSLRSFSSARRPRHHQRQSSGAALLACGLAAEASTGHRVGE